MYKILLIGSQGSGKGTQAELLSKNLNIPPISMGQLLRDEIAKGSEFGIKFDAILHAGELVSDEDAAQVLQARLMQPDTKDGYILDGYPRNYSQFKAFDFDQPTHMLVLDIPKEESVRRLAGRLTCNKCAKVYRVSQGHYADDNCVCGGILFQRDDDTPEAIARRLQVYEEDTQPVIDEYEKQGIVKHIDGVGSIEEVSGRIGTVLDLK